MDEISPKADTQCPDRRMDRHDWILEQHEEDIQELRDSSKSMAASISSINLTLIQIKWLAYGGAGTYIIDSAGIVDVIKAIILR